MDRFTHVAGMEEIEVNDFNLNFSRCLHTTEPIEVMIVEDALAQLRQPERKGNKGEGEEKQAVGEAEVCRLTI